MTDTCDRTGCDQPVKARGLCATHYTYAWRHKTLPPKAPAPEGCSVPECNGKHEARGLCQTHYLRFYVRGTTGLTEPQRALPPEERFRFYVSKDPCECGHGCLLWTGGKIKQGYGAFYVNGKKVMAHRYVYEIEVGPIPPLHLLDHVRERGCRHRDCVNTEHLEPVSMDENVRRGAVFDRSRSRDKVRAMFAEYATERFWAKADRSGGPDAHWLWQAFIDQDGHAKAWWQRRTHMAREVAWSLANGPVPDGKVPKQACGRTDCVNPAHLELADQKAEYARRAAKARAAKAAAHAHPDASLTDQQDAGSARPQQLPADYRH